MARQADIDIKFVHQGRKHRTQLSAVGVRMRLAGAIDIMVEHDDAERCIFIAVNGLLHQLTVFFLVGIVAVEHNKQGFAIAEVVIAASGRRAQIALVGVIEVIAIVGAASFVVPNGRGNRNIL